MPELGEVRKAREIGYTQNHSYIWQACLGCGRERWVKLEKGQPRNIRCQCCNGKLNRGGSNYQYRRGERWFEHGYAMVRLYPEDSYGGMATKTYSVYEHRLLMAKHLGRCLQKGEIIHHKNGIRDDNRIANLELIATLGEHIKNHSKGYKDGYAKGYEDGKSRWKKAGNTSIPCDGCEKTGFIDRR